MKTQLNDTLHYLKFDKKTGKSELVVKEYPIGTWDNLRKRHISKVKTRTNKMRSKRLKSMRAKATRMYNFLFK